MQGPRYCIVLACPELYRYPGQRVPQYRGLYASRQMENDGQRVSLEMIQSNSSGSGLRGKVANHPAKGCSREPSLKTSVAF